jgi:uncharacterized protein (TIGR00661 family)
LVNEKNFNKCPTGPRVLVAPLDWGLGHATRCIPVINELISQGCEVMIAADKAPLFLLKKEFPQTVFLPIYDYKIQYSGNKKRLFLKLLMQFPRIVFSVWKENKWLRKIIHQYQVDAVISDNRFGLHNRRVRSVYITHQLYIKTGSAFSEKIAQKIHYYFIKKFNNCWVPDCRENGLAGDLSHPANLPSNVTYIGPLSRFEKLGAVNKLYDVLIILSGPEPQRTIFEKIILTQLQTFTKKVLFIRGLPGEHATIISEMASTKIVNHLSAEELNIALQQSEMVISRSGYTTVIDLIKLGKKAILVPTPGQTEQEYLSEYLLGKKYFYSIDQNDFSLETAISRTSSFPFMTPQLSFNDYKKVVSEFVLSLKTGNFAPQ